LITDEWSSWQRCCLGHSKNFSDDDDDDDEWTVVLVHRLYLQTTWLQLLAGKLLGSFLLCKYSKLSIHLSHVLAWHDEQCAGCRHFSAAGLAVMSQHVGCTAASS